MLSGVAAQVLQRIFLKLGRFLCQNRFSVMKKLTLVWKGVLWLVSLLEDCVQLLCSRLGSQVRWYGRRIVWGLFLKIDQLVNNNQCQNTASKQVNSCKKDGLGLLFRQRRRKHAAEGRNSLPKVGRHKNIYMCMIFVSQNHHRQTDFFCHDYNNFPSTRYYYLAMAEDIFLRLLWVIGLILKQVGFAIIFSKTGIIIMMRFETCVLVIYIF